VRVFRGPIEPGAYGGEQATVHWIGQTYPDDDFGHTLLTFDFQLDGMDELVVGAPEEPMGIAPWAPQGKVYLIPGGSL